MYPIRESGWKLFWLFSLKASLLGFRFFFSGMPYGARKSKMEVLWIFRLQDEWAVCRIFHKSTGLKKPMSPRSLRINSSVDDDLSGGSLPPLVDPAYSSGPSSSFTDAENNEVKGTAHSSSISKSADANFPYYNVPSNRSHNLLVNKHPSSSHPLMPQSNFTMPYNQVQNPNFFPVRVSPINPSCMNQLETVIRPGLLQCKVEPHLSQSIASGRSQETGLSTDMNPEVTSSAAGSKQEVASNGLLDDLINGSFVGPINSSDILDFSWDYWRRLVADSLDTSDSLALCTYRLISDHIWIGWLDLYFCNAYVIHPHDGVPIPNTSYVTSG